MLQNNPELKSKIEQLWNKFWNRQSSPSCRSFCWSLATVSLLWLANREFISTAERAVPTCIAIFEAGSVSLQHSVYYFSWKWGFHLPNEESLCSSVQPHSGEETFWRNWGILKKYGDWSSKKRACTSGQRRTYQVTGRVVRQRQGNS